MAGLATEMIEGMMPASDALAWRRGQPLQALALPVHTMVWAGEWRGMDRLAGVVGTYEECDFLN
jgi:hypothetical protein